MKVNQIYDLVNKTVKETLGETVVLNEDLSNLVEVGTELFNANAVENYTKTLVDHIGRVVVTDRVYKGGAPKIIKDSWEFGSIKEKIHMKLPEVQANESWELINGASYDTNIFTAPEISAKFFNKRVTFEIDMSITDKQLKSAFSNAQQMNSFLTLITNTIENALTVATDNLILRTIDNAIAETIFDEYPTADYSTKSGVKAVNLLKLYNDEKGTKLTTAKCLTEPEFIRFASYKIKLYTDRMKQISTLFNIGKQEKFTPLDNMKIVLLSEFKSAADIYLQSDTFHNELTKLPNSESVAYWQGSGLDYAFASTSKIDIKTASNHNVNVSGVLGCIFDEQAISVANYERRVATHRNAKAEFTNQYYKQDCEYLNDLNENVVVFFVA